MSRIAIWGISGTGKSTLAARLSKQLRLPLRDADEEVVFLPGWKIRDTEAQRQIVARICAEDDWILDGVSRRWMDIVCTRADLVICLNPPWWKSWSRLLRRTFIDMVTRKVICNGNRENLKSLGWCFYPYVTQFFGLVDKRIAEFKELCGDRVEVRNG